MHSNFEKQFERTRKMAIGFAIVLMALGIGILGLTGWVVIKVMDHFSII